MFQLIGGNLDITRKALGECRPPPRPMALLSIICNSTIETSVNTEDTVRDVSLASEVVGFRRLTCVEDR